MAVPYSLSQILLWLFVINLGIAYGAGLYEQRIVAPLWFPRVDGRITVNREAMRATDPGRKFWGLVTTVPLTLLTLVNLALAWNAHAARRDWWFIAALVSVVERIATFAYFIPTLLHLVRDDLPATVNVGAVASRWMAFNHLRTTLGLGAWLAALAALGLAG